MFSVDTAIKKTKKNPCLTSGTTTNTPTFATPKGSRKRTTNKVKVRRRKEIKKIRAEINKIEFNARIHRP